MYIFIWPGLSHMPHVPAGEARTFCLAMYSRGRENDLMNR